MKSSSNTKGWNITLWIAQVLLAAMFFMAGFTKATKALDELVVIIPWTPALPLTLVRSIGIAEMLGAVGLLLPSLLRIKPILTPVAASALALVMTMAIIFHITRSEFSAILLNLSFGLIAAFIAWGRSRKAAIMAK